MEKELKKLNFYLDIDGFKCGFIVVDNQDDDTIDFIKSNIKKTVSYVSDCNSLETLYGIKNRVMLGERIILYNLEQIYDLFAINDKNRDGIYMFYQRFTETYRDNLWDNNKGQIYFIVTKEEFEQFYNPKDVEVFLNGEKRLYSRDNHFRTMLTVTIDLTTNVMNKVRKL